MHRKMPDAKRLRRARGGNPCKCHVSVFGARDETCPVKFRGYAAPCENVFVKVIRGETCSRKKESIEDAFDEPEVRLRR